MRIVSGAFRAKKLLSPTHDIRPTLDKVKQALFTRLQFEVAGAAVLDLFAGSGALGVEALSRGAGKVVFCDVDSRSVALTKKNLQLIKLTQNQTAQVHKIDYLKFLEVTDEKFDIILLDPPYEKGFYLPALQQIAQRKLLKSGGVIVCERLRNMQISTDLFALETTKNYGSVALDYFVNK